MSLQYLKTTHTKTLHPAESLLVPPSILTCWFSALYAFSSLFSRSFINLSNLNNPHASGFHAKAIAIKQPSMTKNMRTVLLRLAAIVVLALGATSAKAGNNLALKTNLLWDAALSPNIGAEVVLAPRWSLDLSAQLNAWTLNGGHRWKHWLVQPEVRYWFCESFGGHFLAAHAIGGAYNFGKLPWHKFLNNDLGQLRDRRYQGWGAGLGVGYGYSWPLAKHWSVEAEIALGWIYTRYDVYPCAKCGTKIESDRSHNYFGPTKAAINLIYVF